MWGIIDLHIRRYIRLKTMVCCEERRACAGTLGVDVGIVAARAHNEACSSLLVSDSRLLCRRLRSSLVLSL